MHHGQSTCLPNHLPMPLNMIYFGKVTKMASELDIGEATLPRKKKFSRHYDSGHAGAEFPSTPKDHHRQIYFEAVDLIVQSITEQFNQPDYKVYLQLEICSLKLLRRWTMSEFRFLSTLYGADINKTNLQLQLYTLAANLASTCNNLTDVRDFNLYSRKNAYDEVMTIMNLW